MRLLKAGYKILFVTPDAPQMIERCGRVCYKSEDKQINQESAIKFCKMLFDRGHHSVLEHAYATVHITTDRGVSHEIVRHRIASYSQESTRFCNYSPCGKAGKNSGGHINFIIPPWLSLSEGDYKIQIKKNGIIDIFYNNNLIYLNTDEYDHVVILCQEENDYNMKIAKGWKPEQARGYLGNFLKTEIICTYNAREWLWFFAKRCNPAAHPQMREISIPLQQELVPKLFGQMLEIKE